MLSDLCFIDEREKELDALRETLLFGSCGVNGQFLFQELFDLDYINEVTSTYAQAAFMLDFLRPSRLLAKSEIADLRVSIDQRFLNGDHTLEEITGEFGPASIEIGGGDTHVACYACADGNEDWVFFDFFRRRPLTDPNAFPRVEEPWFEIPRLRNVRLEGNKMLLVPFGASLAKPLRKRET